VLTDRSAIVRVNDYGPTFRPLRPKWQTYLFPRELHLRFIETKTCPPSSLFSAACFALTYFVGAPKIEIVSNKNACRLKLKRRGSFGKRD